MKRLLYIAFILALSLTLLCPAALAEEASDENDGDVVYTLIDGAGNPLTLRAGRIYTDDEYISSDNKLYRVTSVDDVQRIAVAQYMGDEPAVTPEARAAFRALAEEAQTQSENKLICMYSTHSDESYEPTDGTESKTEDAGIYDVGNALKKNLEARGITVHYDQQTHLPHDAGAYRRSRQTAEELMKQQPEALLDLHRDGIPDPDEYEQEIDGEEASKVRLLVGRSNPNADANRAFAKEIKAVADEKYPGLIKDIFIGKGNYNQELYPQAILLEFGTHTIEKERAIASTEYMANVLDEVLFGGSAKAETEASSAGAGKGIAWLVGAAIVIALIYVLASTGSFKNMKAKLSRGANEVTGGLHGRRDDDKP